MSNQRYESIGTADGAFDDDYPASHPLIQTDAACASVWRHGGYESVEVYIDPVLRDRIDEICSAMDAVCGAHEDLDGLSDDIAQYAQGAGLSHGIYPRPEGRLSEGNIAVVFTLG